MQVDELFSHINSAYRGSDDNAPVEGTDDYSLWINTTNRKQSEWAHDGKSNWASLWIDDVNIGTIAEGTNVFDLDDQFLLPDSKVTVTDLSGNENDFTIVKPAERDRYTNSVYISGADPQVLTFSDDIDTSSTLIGGAVNISGYTIPDDIASDTDTILVDDPYWLVMAVASELAFNDLTYADKAPDLNAKAGSLYEQMASNNRRGSNNNPRTARTNVDKIIGVSYKGTQG